MTGAAAAAAADGFAASRQRFGLVVAFLDGGEAAAFSAAELEKRVHRAGREVLRQLLPDPLGRRTRGI